DGFRRRRWRSLDGAAFAIATTLAFGPGFLPLPRMLPIAMTNFAGRLVAAGDRRPFQFLRLFLVFQFEEIRYIEERIALQPEVHKGGLHAGEHARYALVIDRSSESVLVFALVVDFRELVVFKNRKPRLMRRAGDTYLFCHRTFPPGGLRQPGPAAQKGL